MTNEDSLSEQVATHADNHERHQFAKQIDAEALAAEREAVIAFIDRRAAFLNNRSWIGDTFRVAELLQLVGDLKAGRHAAKQEPTK